MTGYLGCIIREFARSTNFAVHWQNCKSRVYDRVRRVKGGVVKIRAVVPNQSIAENFVVRQWIISRASKRQWYEQVRVPCPLDKHSATVARWLNNCNRKSSCCCCTHARGEEISLRKTLFRRAHLSVTGRDRIIFFFSSRSCIFCLKILV